MQKVSKKAPTQNLQARASIFCDKNTADFSKLHSIVISVLSSLLYFILLLHYRSPATYTILRCYFHSTLVGIWIQLLSFQQLKNVLHVLDSGIHCPFHRKFLPWIHTSYSRTWLSYYRGSSRCISRLTSLHRSSHVSSSIHIAIRPSDKLYGNQCLCSLSYADSSLDKTN